MTTAPVSNPTLYSDALSAAELDAKFKWHTWSQSERSSQVYCVSAFGSLRTTTHRDLILEETFRSALPDFPTREEPQRWTITLEAEDPALLSEYGSDQPTSIDALCVSRDEVICIESKFATDAEHGFGSCGQTKKACAGFRGPGSDISTRSSAWCRLESWDGKRSPRAYWSLGHEYFRPEVFRQQAPGDVCPMSGKNYQLMRNFLFAAAMAKRDRKSFFGVVTIAPRKFAAGLQEQVRQFRENVLLPEFAHRISHLDYEDYIQVLRNTGRACASDLGCFLEERISTVIGS